MTELSKKYGFALIALMCIFYAWTNAESTALQTITLPAILAYFFLLSKQKKSIETIRVFLIILLIGLLVFPPLLFKGIVNDDGKFSDTPTAIKAATIFLLQGKNPYTENYYGTALEKVNDYIIKFWEKQGQNDYPPLKHFVYLPGIFLASVPYYLALPGLSFYFLALIILIALIATVAVFLKGESLELFLLLAFFNPFIFYSLQWGQSADFMILLFMVLFTIFFTKTKYFLAGIFFGLALTTKLYSLVLVPFFFYYFWKQKRIDTIIAATICIAAIMLPFALWDFTSFIDDTVLTILGGQNNNIAIWQSGVGFLPLLKSLGIVSDSMKWVSLPLMLATAMIVFVVFLHSKISLKKTFVFSAIAFTATMFFSKFISSNYISFPYYLILCFVLAEIAEQEKRTELHENKI